MNARPATARWSRLSRAAAAISGVAARIVCGRSRSPISRAVTPSVAMPPTMNGVPASYRVASTPPNVGPIIVARPATTIELDRIRARWCSGSTSCR